MMMLTGYNQLNFVIDMAMRVNIMKIENIKNILLDLDGTLTDSKQGIQASINYAMQKQNQPLDPNINLDWAIGPSLKQTFHTLLNTEDDAIVAQALIDYRERFASIGLFENQLYDGVVDTLAWLKSQNYQIYLATAKPHIYAKRILKHFAIDTYFTHAYGSELTGERMDKAELIAYILQQQQLNPTQCLMVGDRKYDIQGAHANRLDAVAVRYGYGTVDELDAVEPNAYINHFSELRQMLSVDEH